mgnify:CR=1 FL=1
MSSPLSDPTLAAAIEHLPAIREEVAGCLSEPETAYTLDAEHAKLMRSYYERALDMATDARFHLANLIAAGLPPLKPLPDGGTSGADGLRHAALRAHIRAYVFASAELHFAARNVCDAEELADDGAAEGIVWEVPL